jgi:4-hydroxythreonine-4-phosphate dehydrogenase
VITPAIEQARSEGIEVEGPIGADTLIQRPGFDAYVVMLHDQGHVAAKLLAPHRVAGLTIGTPVLFSSVAHGSALDIAGQGRADPAAIVEAITRIVARRRRAAAT